MKQKLSLKDPKTQYMASFSELGLQKYRFLRFSEVTIRANFFNAHLITTFTYVILENFHAQNLSFTGSFQDIFTQALEFSRRDI